jgi:class 3 adenylate cyclase
LRNHGDVVVDEIERFVTGSLSRFSDRMRTSMLFTDIVASTEMAARVGEDEWSKLIDEHNRRVLRQVDACGGEQLKHTGDGFLVAFEQPDSAIRCATRCMAAVTELGVELRAGVHVGEVARMGNRDLAGLEVHFAQRLCARAGTGEVLVSAAVRDACAGTGIRFEERGKAELKGIPGVWEVFAAQV